MTSYQERKFSMYLTLKDLLSNTSYTASLAALPSFNIYLTNFLSNVQNIQNTRVVQELNSSGLAVNKKELRDDLVSKAMDIVSKLKAYAVVSTNNVLLSEVSYTKSSLMKVADTILRDKTQLIYNKASANAASLVPFGITTAMLSAFQIAITSYLVAIPKPRTGIIASKLTTAQLKTLFSNIEDLLFKMDILIESVEVGNNSLYQSYFDSRKVINDGFSLIALRGIVYNATTATVLSGVIVHIMDSSMKTKSTVKGYFSFKSLQGGSYVLVFSKNGFVTQSVSVNVTDGERTEVRVDLMVE